MPVLGAALVPGTVPVGLHHGVGGGPALFVSTRGRAPGFLVSRVGFPKQGLSVSLDICRRSGRECPVSELEWKYPARAWSLGRGSLLPPPVPPARRKPGGAGGALGLFDGGYLSGSTGAPARILRGDRLVVAAAVSTLFVRSGLGRGVPVWYIGSSSNVRMQ